jgi:alkylation response protein AidB-like acyl-CoA dehydrogenase
MNFSLSEEQAILCAMFERLLTQHSTSERIRAAEASGFDANLWDAILETGIVSMRIPENLGGGGMGLIDAVAVVETAGRHLASVPLVETLVASNLLAKLDTPEARDWLARIQSGAAIATIALQPLVPSVAQIVPAAGVAHLVIACDGECVVLSAAGQDGTPPMITAGANFGSIPIASWALSAVGEIGQEGSKDHVSAFMAAVEEWKLLTAAMVAAMGRRALEIAADYARERTAFGKPIGSYQGLAHPLADSWTDIEGARLLVLRAVWMIACHPEAAGASISEAFWWTADRIGNATVRAMRAFGGYGMTFEYDAELYFRRARAHMMVAGDPNAELLRAGNRLWAQEAVSLPDAGNVAIDFSYGADAEAVANEARAFFAAKLTPTHREFIFQTEDGYSREIHVQLAEAGLLFPDWPESLGGRGLGPYEMSAVKRVYGEFDWSTTASGVTSMVGRVVAKFGTEALKQEVLPQVTAGRINFALGYSEPSGGSDVFAARTRAVRDGDDWVIDGSKMFTSQGHIASYTLMITRTNPDAPKHAGVTMFLVPLDRPGYVCQEIRTVGGERTNITFYEGLRVPDRYRIGDVDDGASVMAYALTLEQSSVDYYYNALSRQLRHALAWAHTQRSDGSIPIDSADTRMRLARVRTRLNMLDGLGRRCLWSAVEGCQEKAFGPMTKLFGSEAWHSSASELMDLMAPNSLVRGNTDVGIIEQEYRRSVPSTIYAGTSEVLRSIVAESALKLPRSRV